MARQSAQDPGHQLVQAFLTRHAPFDQMLARHRLLLEEQAELLEAADGEVLIRPEDGHANALFVIVDGRVRGSRPATAEDSGRFVLETGDSFPMGALLGERATRTVYTADGRVRYLRLPREGFARLFKESVVFRDYCIRGVSSLLDQVQDHIQSTALQNLGAESSFDTELGQLMHADPVVCGPQESIRGAVQRMHQRKVGSIVVVDDQQRPLGIFTLHDLRAGIAGRADLDGPIQAVMTPDPQTLNAETLAFEAVLLMARRHIRHVVVTHEGRLAGVISERDLFALQRINVVHVRGGLGAADCVDVLAAARGAIGRLIEGMMAHGAAVEQITRIITLLNDRTTLRAIELCLAEAEDPGVEITWLAFGSEGRSEQTLVTDQDNGILFEPGDESPEAVRQRLLPIAKAINDALDRCGFPLCKGNVMASNPKLCLSAAEWAHAFGTIIRSNTPENLLRSSIYFDFRAIYGDEAAAARLQSQVLQQASSTSLFLHMMAGNALQNRPPLGLIRDFVTERGEEGDTLDLKMRGLSPFVDGARLLALEGGLPETNTLERFQALAPAGIASRDEVGAWNESFAFIQMVRMRHHLAQAREGKPMTNHLDPDTLNPMDRRILKEAFRQCRGLQKKLEVRYQVR